MKELALNSIDKVVSSLLTDNLPEYALKNKGVFCLKNTPPGGNEVAFYRVKQLSFDEEYPHREAFENVLQSLENDAFNFVYILDGDERGVSLYFGIVKNQRENAPIQGKLLNAADYGRIVSGVFEGNFSGSHLEKLQGESLKDLLTDTPARFENAGMIVGIPSANESQDDRSKYGFQGMDRLINSMMGAKWRIAIICEPVAKDTVQDIQNRIYEIYDELAKVAKKSYQASSSSGSSRTDSTNKSTADSTNYSENKSNTSSKGKQSQYSNSSQQTSIGTTYGEGKTITNGTGESKSVNFSQSNALTVEIISKKAQEIMKYIDEELLERVKLGYSKGLFQTSFYYMGEKPADADRLKSGIMSMFQGSHSSYSPLRAIPLNPMYCQELFRSYQNPYIKSDNLPGGRLTLLGHPYTATALGVSTYMTAKEVSLIAGLPQKEIPGLTVRESVDFGLNITKSSGDVFLGHLLQKGRELPISVDISRDVLNKHVFIAGVTGSGKTTTCHRLLREANCPFLVIEPAKTEYRTLIRESSFRHVVVFTVGDELTAPFRLNPFEIVPGESISSHIDMLKATFTSAFPMEASMPQILEEAICKAYEDKGWDIDTSEFEGEGNKFPVLSDFLKALEDIVETKGFSDRLRDDYRGSLVSRFSNLTKGTKGAIFNSEHSVDFERLIKGNVIIELENLKSAEDKSLLMGFILMRLSAVIKKRHEDVPDFRHITLIEEAHRLLSKPDYGDSGSKRTAVETFTDLLAEVRKYGESLVIVDQIPNKLASEVLKNTNTKIIHKLFARDDKEAVGDTMLMNDKQKEYLSALEPGQAILFSEGMPLPVHVKIEKITDTNEDLIPNDEVKERFLESYGEEFFHSELIKKFYRPLYAILKKVADETKDNWLAPETMRQIMDVKARLTAFCRKVNESEAAEENYDVDFISKEIASHCRKKLMMDVIFQERVAKFLLVLLGDETVDEQVLDSRETYRMLSDIRRFG